MATSSKLKLFDSDDDDSDAENCELTINKDYAEKYSAWKEKEELMKLKEKYGDLSDYSSTSEDEEQVNWNAEFDKEWLRVYSAVKFKDKDIYDKDIQFVRDEGEEDSKEEEGSGSESDSSESEREAVSKKKKKMEDDKPLTIRDHERRIMTDRKGAVSESEDEEEVRRQTQGPGYHEEQEAIRQSITKAVADMSSSDEDGEILTRRVKSEQEKKKEEEEYLQFLKGEKEAKDLKSQDKEIAKELAPLRNFFSKTEEDGAEAQKVVWNTLICRGTAKEKLSDAEEDLDEESELKEMEDDEEEFEYTYNFRFEEPDKNFIKQYKRNPEDSVRQEANKRAQKRKEIQQRKKMAMEERREEIRRLKKLKQKELEGRLQLLVKECPTGVDFSQEELRADFDPKAYDRMMQEKFDKMDEEDDDEDEEKPDMADLEDVLSIDSYEDIFEEGDKSVVDSSHREEEEEEEEENLGGEGSQSKQKESKVRVDAGYDPSWIPDMSRLSKKARRRRKSKFQQALDAEKPLFSEVHEKYKDSATPWEDYVQEYYKLDYKEHGFHYRNVVPNDYGIHPGEILWLPTRELNSWVSMKKVVEQKPESEELYEQRKYQSAKLQRKILNVMPSLKKIEDEESKYEDIRPSVLRQKKMALLDAEEDSDGSDMSESEQPAESAEEELGSRLHDDSLPSPKKKRKADFSESAVHDAPSPKKKKRLKESSTQLFNNIQETSSTREPGHQGDEGKKKKKKKKKKVGINGGHESLDTEVKKTKPESTDNQTELHWQSVEKKKKMMIKLENKGVDIKAKKKDKVGTMTDGGGEQETSVKKKKKQTAKVEGEQPGPWKTDKKKLKGKKKQKKRGDGTPKVKGYIAKDKIQESRLAAFHIDPRKFKYTKNRIIPLQHDQD